MQAGKLKHHIEIQCPENVRSASGAVSYQEWHPFCYAWASIEPLSGREYFAAAQAQSEVSHKITIRYKSEIKPHYRILWADRIFDIVSPPLDKDEIHIELTLFCKELVK